MTTRLVMPVDFIGCFGDRKTIDDIFEFHHAINLGQDRTGIRVPLGQTLAALDLVAFIDMQT